VHRFNREGPEELVNRPSPGRRGWLGADQLRELAEIVETGPDPQSDGVVRWRRIDLKQLIEDRCKPPRKAAL
jgi:transposase